VSEAAAPTSAAPSSPSSAPAEAPPSSPAKSAATATPSASPQRTAAKPSSAGEGGGTQRSGAAAALREGDGAEAAAAEAKEEARKEAERRKYKYRANKEDVEEELTDEEVALRLAKVKGSEKAFQERAEYEKALKEFFTNLKADPFEVLKDPAFGIDLEDLAQRRLAERYERSLEESRLTEDQKAARAAKEEAERYKKQLESIENEKKAVAQKEYQAKVEADIKTTLEGALAELDVDASPETLYEAARLMKINLQQGLRLTPAQIASEVRRLTESRNDKFHKAVLSNLKGEKLLKYLGGPESPVLTEVARLLGTMDTPAVKELVKARLAKLRGPEAFKSPVAAQPTDDKPTEKGKFDRASWRRELVYGRNARD
jgi:hypothetical protein